MQITSMCLLFIFIALWQAIIYRDFFNQESVLHFYLNDKSKNHFFCFYLSEIPLFLIYWSSGDRVSTTDLRLPPVSVTYCDELWIHEILSITSLLPPAGNILEFEPETEFRTEHRNCQHAWQHERMPTRTKTDNGFGEQTYWNRPMKERLRLKRLRDRHRLLHLSHHLNHQ